MSFDERRVFFLSFCLLAGAYVVTWGSTLESVSSMIDASYQACRTEKNPAMAVSMVKDGVTLLSRGFGYTDLHGNTLVTGSTRFNVASLTKAITAALLVKLMEESGKYNLSTKVRHILGRQFRFADDMRTEEATVEDLLAHKMAIPPNNRIRFDPTLTRQSLVRRLRYLESYDTFRTTYLYSNIMYGLLSRMTEIIGGGRWEDLVTSHLFNPLQMSRSTFTTQAKLTEENTVKPYEDYFGKLEAIHLDLPGLHSELVGSGAFISTADDMAKWMNFHLYEGLNEKGDRVMSAESVRELYQPRMTLPGSQMSYFLQPDIPVTTSFDVYALGWWRGYYRGYPILGHSGSTYGYRSLIVLIPSKKAGAFVAMSGDDVGYLYRGPVINLMLDHLLGIKESWVDANILCTFPSPWFNVSSQVKSPPYVLNRPLARNITAYIGTYSNPGYGRLDVVLTHKQGSTPQLTVKYGFGSWDLLPLPPKSPKTSVDSLEHFYGKGRDLTNWIDYSPFIFLPPPKGINYIVQINVPAFETRLPPVFTRVTEFDTSGTMGSKLSSVLVTLTLVMIVFGCTEWTSW